MATPAAPHDHRIASPHGSLYAREWTPARDSGAAPIILLHDSLGSVALWRGFPAALAQATERRVIAYDRLGFGQSDAHPSPIPLTFIADEAQTGLHAVLEHFGLAHFALFGHSVGGGMAVHAAARYGTSCAALVTVAAQAFVETRTRDGIREAQAMFADPVQFDRLRKYHGDKAQWVLDSWVHSWLHPDFDDWSLRPVLPALRSPLLAIHGEEDEYGSPAQPQLLAELAGGGAELFLMPATHHMPHREREAEVLARISAFLHSKG